MSAMKIFSWLVRLSFFAAVLVSIVTPLGAAVLSWSGGSAVSGNWGDSANWGFAGTPTNGDTLVFPAAQPRPANTNNLASLVLAEVRFAGAGGGYAIYGNAFTLTNRLAATNTAGANTIFNNVTLSTANLTVDVASSASLTLSGQLAGTVGLTKAGAGTLTYAYSSSNPYSGTTRVNAGVLQLNVGGVNAFGGPLVIGDGSGTGSPTVRLLQSTEIPDAQPITLNLGGLLDLNNFSETIGTILTFSNSATVQSGSGTLTLSANATVTVNAGNSTLSGNLNNGSGTCLFDADGNLTVSALISGTATLAKSGMGTVTFTGANTYSGLTLVQQGLLWVQNSLGLGTSANGTVVSNLASLVMSGGIGVTNEALTLNGPGVSAIWGALDAEGSGTNIWAGPITVNADSTIVPYASSTHLRIIGAISGAGGVEKFANSSGTLYFEGNTANTYGGLTKIIAGTNILAKASVFDGAIPHDLQMGDPSHGAVVRYAGANQIPNSSIITLNDDCWLDLNNQFDGIGGLVLYGAQVTMGTGFLDMYSPATITSYSSTNAQSVINGRIGLITPTTINAVELPAPFWFSYQLEINATIYGSQSLTVMGDGATSLYASNYFTGQVIVNAGVLRVENDYALGTTGTGTIVSNGGSITLWGGIDVGNEPLTLHGMGFGGGAFYAGLYTNSWAGPITFASDTSIYVGNTPNTGLILTGTLNGPGGFTKLGPGMLTLAGPSANNYAGDTIVNDGTLLLDKAGTDAAVPGPGNLIVGDGLGGTATDIVREMRDFQIASSVDITVNQSGLLDLNDHTDTVGALALLGGRVQTGTGTLTLSRNVAATMLPSAPSYIYGHLALGAATRTFHVTNTAGIGGWLIVNAEVSGAGGLVKTGEGLLSLMSSNSYSGLTTAAKGALEVRNRDALGSTAVGTVVLDGAEIVICNAHVGAEPLTLSGLGIAATMYSWNYGGPTSNSWAGHITLQSAVSIAVEDSANTLNFLGAIGGPGGLAMSYPGTLVFSGTAANTYGGNTLVNAGKLWLNKSGYDSAIPHGLSVLGTVRLLAANQISDSADVLVYGGGLFDLGTVGEYVDTLHGAGTVNFGTGGYLGIGLNNGTSQFDGPMTGIGYAPGWTLSKWGTGTFTVTGINTYSAGQTHVFGGKLVVNGSQSQSTVVVDAGATLAGTGTVGPIQSQGGIISPGASHGRLHVIGNAILDGASKLRLELFGTAPGIGYDQLEVTGDLAANEATLELVLGFAGAVSNQYVIVDHPTGWTSTLFKNLPNGGTVTTPNGAQFSIAYAAGDGNDTVLTQQSAPPLLRVLDAAPLAGGNRQVVGTGMPDQLHTVMASTNLSHTNWLELGTTTASEIGQILFTDLQSTNFPHRFYRLRQP